MKTFHMGAVSGLVATLAADNPVFAWRKPTGTLCDQYIERIRIKCMVTTPPGTAQAFALQVHKLTAMTANFSGGTDLSDPAGANNAIQVTTLDRLRVREADQIKASILAAANVEIASTGTLTSAGAPVIKAQPFMVVGGFANTTAIGGSTEFEGEWTPALSRVMSQTPVDGCFPLLDDEGFIIRAPFAIATALVVRFAVEVDWFEQ
jgi:hypothetical protein